MMVFLYSILITLMFIMIFKTLSRRKVKITEEEIDFRIEKYQYFLDEMYQMEPTELDDFLNRMQEKKRVDLEKWR